MTHGESPWHHPSRSSAAYATYLRRVIDYQTQHPQQRRGQVYFNVLAEMDPAAAQQIHATPQDPFYLHERADLEEFRTWLRTHWNEL